MSEQLLFGEPADSEKNREFAADPVKAFMRCIYEGEARKHCLHPDFPDFDTWLSQLKEIKEVPNHGTTCSE